MNIGILTYNKFHLKSYRILAGLKKKNYNNIVLIYSNLKKIKKRNVIFSHRPEQFRNSSIFEIAKKFKIKTISIKKKNCFDNLDIVLIGGSQLIPNVKIKKNFILNCHSGLIPQTRGLDSFKWAIIKNQLVGNTLHFINNDIDLGKIVYSEITKCYSKDSLKKFAKRHYENEVKMLINFEKNIKKKKIINLRKKPPTMRMPNNIEINLNNHFKDNWKKKFCND